MTLQDNEREQERALLVGLNLGQLDFEESMEELELLAESAGCRVVVTTTQSLPAVVRATYVGTGKIQEIAEICKNDDIDVVIFNNELSPMQFRNIEKVVGVKVVDRTTLILDIFAKRARSSEGKIQVELAQLQYILPRLAGRGTALSRLGGGIGTRGPGETKLETDKRHIRQRIKVLQRQLDIIEMRRKAARERREKNRVCTVAIVGYTNAGKSTLLNALTNAGVLAEDKLFATLDPTARALKLPDGRQVMLIDTVGFVRDLPHHLVEAFKSTLAEAAEADVVLNVVDASSCEIEKHLEVTNRLLEELGRGDKPVITVFNKDDLNDGLGRLPVVKNSVRISALLGYGLDRLLEAIAREIPRNARKVKLLLPFSVIGKVAKIREKGEILSEEYTESGLLLEAVLDIEFIGELSSYII